MEKVSLVLVRFHWQLCNFGAVSREERWAAAGGHRWALISKTLKLFAILHIPEQSFSFAHSSRRIAWQYCRFHSLHFTTAFFTVFSFIVRNRLWFLNGPNTKTHPQICIRTHILFMWNFKLNTKFYLWLICISNAVGFQFHQHHRSRE